VRRDQEGGIERQPPFFGKYCDEAYAIIDAIDTKKKQQGLNAGKLKLFLSTVSRPRKARRRKARR
jgi:hypothetical protein